jgi:hypothetical protein
MARAWKRKYEPIDSTPKITRMHEPTGTGDVFSWRRKSKTRAVVLSTMPWFFPPVLERTSGNGLELFSIRKKFAVAVDRKFEGTRMMSSLEGTVRWDSKATRDFYSIFDNSVVTSEFFCQHKTVLSWGRVLFTKARKPGKPNSRSFDGY